MLLDVKDIWIHYGKVEAIRGVSFGVEEGEIATLIGSNGAGKTTILRTLSGLKSPTSGEIWFKGERIDKMPSHRIVQMGIAQSPEGRRVFPYMSVAENLIMGAYARRDREVGQDMEWVYQIFPRLKERAWQQGRTLSGGEQQMLAIARALMARPKLLLLDEPSLGLAPLIIGAIAEVIKEINKTGITIILVEQNARLALGLAHKGYLLETGNLVLAGDAKDLANSETVQRIYLGG